MDQELNAGRPTTFTPELGDVICQKIIDGVPLRKIAAPEDMPATSTILLWVAKGFRGAEEYKAFSEQYCLAREAQSELFMDEIIGIADDDSLDYMFVAKDEESGKSARAVLNHEHVTRSKLRIETRLKAAEKFAAKRYGPKPENSVSVNVNGLPLPEQDKALLDEYAKGQ